ncbi:SAM-dependent MidA family methyltransferase [Albidovulum inexpectatum]|uniref:SAM-dependent MidA family methyltransferase n=1 Tax=Albidovulum inexpectatum TaxID=196587 RepID=A0A2S5JEN0_9RHOB|nr:SAM-dependent methyltransferase [Albidovulum inexpectatum]PPB79881.1 SAM-dependent MidA family methyltransferase [Albidovulum inexpectatum]
MTTPLGRFLIQRIAASGPISLAEYMAECLLHPDHGYYATRDPLGRAGDFTTAPEISQMFGEMLGLALAQAWLDQGRPTPFVLAEPGPGRGTLMSDILRTIRAVPGMADAARIYLIEASPTLRARQAETLKGHDPVWLERVEDLPGAPLFVVANEFFDALPIRQFVRKGDGWAERQVGLVDGRLAPGLAPPVPLAALADRLADTREGDVVEICPALPGIAAEIGRRIAAHGGAALIVDYGGWHSLGDTFQAVRGHSPVDPLAEPGLADLTAHVDFEALALGLRAGGAVTTAMTPQGVFLERLGITGRAQRLANGLSGDKLESHIAAHRRLTHPGEMGQLFKVIGAHPPGCPPPPGLDPA